MNSPPLNPFLLFVLRALHCNRIPVLQNYWNLHSTAVVVQCPLAFPSTVPLRGNFQPLSGNLGNKNFSLKSPVYSIVSVVVAGSKEYGAGSRERREWMSMILQRLCDACSPRHSISTPFAMTPLPPGAVFRDLNAGIFMIIPIAL